MEEPPASTTFTAEVCFGELRHREHFRTTLPDLRAGEECVVRTDRGVETGRIVSPARPVEEAEGAEPAEDEAAAAAAALPEDPAVAAAPPEDAPRREILRRVSPDDRKRLDELRGPRRQEALEHCRERIAARNLPMRLVQVEHLLGGNRIIFYFTAPRRVDFRDLVRDLSRKFRTRIELRQIGARDEARVLGDDEMCGRELCCRSYVRDLKPVTMKMAKNQKTTLDPSRISGRCGRLMCCLRYEDEAYSELRARMPRCGRDVETPHGPGRVVAQDVLRQCVDVRLQGGRRVQCTVREIETGRADEDDAAR